MVVASTADTPLTIAAKILESRVQSTRVLGRALAVVQRPPQVWLLASTPTIDAHCYDAPNDEITGFIGGDEAGAGQRRRAISVRRGPGS